MLRHVREDLQAVLVYDSTHTCCCCCCYFHYILINNQTKSNLLLPPSWLVFFVLVFYISVVGSVSSWRLASPSLCCLRHLPQTMTWPHFYLRASHLTPYTLRPPCCLQHSLLHPACSPNTQIIYFVHCHRIPLNLTDVLRTPSPLTECLRVSLPLSLSFSLALPASCLTGAARDSLWAENSITP